MKRWSLALGALLVSGSCLAGTWGPGSFDNDAALDWAGECVATKDSTVIAATLKAALQAATLEESDAAAAVAAAEVVAAAKGRPARSLSKELLAWLHRQPQREIAKLSPIARKVLVRVKDASVSELSQLWSESADKQWQNAVAELDARLK